MLEFDLYNVEKVVFHTYRTARTFPVVCAKSYDRGDEVDQLRDNLAELAGKQKDNHTVYEVTFKTGEKVFYWFSDWKLRIGLTLHKNNY